ncbi:hypothetical protein WJX84_007410 [Apatococcus fuscideae]|uniref:Uncharacterized protein n=1 Tax=Apatococcus fuscideae TaxID=2026836 RepID=A0AAW1T218_9CHLO
MVSTRFTVAAVALAAVFLAVSIPVSQGWLLPGIGGGWPFGNPYYGVPCVCDGEGHLRPWVGAEIIATVDIVLVKEACAKAGIAFYENIQIYFYSGGQNNFCYGSIRPFFSFDLVVEFAQSVSFGPQAIWNACYYHGLPGFGSLWG